MLDRVLFVSESPFYSTLKAFLYLLGALVEYLICIFEVVLNNRCSKMMNLVVFSLDADSIEAECFNHIYLLEDDIYQNLVQIGVDDSPRRSQTTQLEKSSS